MDGLIHLYEGDGKGKTTAAVGLAVRCAGSGGKVLFSQFLKDGTSSELSVLKKTDGIDVYVCEKKFGFVFLMSTEEKELARTCYRDFFKLVWEKAKTDYDMVVLDEVFGLIEVGFLDKDDFEEILKEKPEHLEMVCTGRNPDELFHDSADYITVMQKVKHPFDLGVAARKGIEL